MLTSQFLYVLQRLSGTKVFGIPLHNLVGKDEIMPQFMENLIAVIETHGLFTEGIYRKSGAAHKIKTLKMLLDSGIKGKPGAAHKIKTLKMLLDSGIKGKSSAAHKIKTLKMQLDWYQR